MRNVLAVDIGGTKTLFQISNEQGQELFKLRLDSQSYPSFEAILTAFLNQEQAKAYTLSTACFAVAGPVKGNTASVTKLPWLLDKTKLAEQFGFGNIVFCNDFEAVGHGIACLADADVVTIYEGNANPEANRAVLGAGTGLGEAMLIPEGKDWRVLATEGGHVDFAPTDRIQALLLQHMQERFGHVPYDRLVCGSGIEIMYHFLRDYKQIKENEALRMAMFNADGAAVISEFAQQHQEPLAVETMNMFFKIYGAQAGNFALVSLAQGGVYLAGGIAAKNLELLKQSQFISAFLNKGRMQHVVETMPVKVVLDHEVGLKGARLLALKALYN